MSWSLDPFPPGDPAPDVKQRVSTDATWFLAGLGVDFEERMADVADTAAREQAQRELEPTFRTGWRTVVVGDPPCLAAFAAKVPGCVDWTAEGGLSGTPPSSAAARP